MSFDKEATEIPQLCAQAKSRNEPRPPIPKSFAEALIVNLIMPLLDDLA